MKIKFCFIFLFSIIYCNNTTKPQRNLNDKEILSQIIDNHDLMQCMFVHSISQNQDECMQKFNLDEQFQKNVKKVQQFIQQINEKDKSCQEIVDQQNFINCRKKITFEIKQQNNVDQSLEQNTQLVAHIFTGYFNSLENIQQKQKETQQKFQQFVEDKKTTNKGETNLQIQVNQNDDNQQQAASELINSINKQKQDAKHIIQQTSPKNLEVEMLDHTIQKFNIDEDDNPTQVLDNLNTLLQQKVQNDVDPLVSKGVKNLKEDDLTLINKKIQTYESLGKTNDIINFLFKDVSDKLEILKKEQERNKVLSEEKSKINQSLDQDLYSKNLDDSNKKIQQLRQEITDHLIYLKSLVNQRQLDMNIIRRLSSMDELNQTIIKKNFEQKKVERNLLQKNVKQIESKFKDQIILLKKNYGHKDRKQKKDLKQALLDQNTSLKIKNLSRKLLQKNNLEKQIERRLSESERVYESIQGFEVLENIQQIHSMQQSLVVEEKIKSEILHRIQQLIIWKDTSIQRLDSGHHGQTETEAQEKSLVYINETYNQQIRYMLDALQVVEERKYNQQIRKLKRLQAQRKKIKANQLLTEQYDLSEFQVLEQDKGLQELMEQNMKTERQIAKQSNQLQRLRTEFIKNKNEIDVGFQKFQHGLEKNKKQILKRLHKQNESQIQKYIGINIIVFVLGTLF